MLLILFKQNQEKMMEFGEKDSIWNLVEEKRKKRKKILVG